MTAPQIDPLSDWPVGEPVPAISIRQPWAAAVVWLGKDVENRSQWLYGHRGPMIIHASNSRFYRDELEGMLEIAHREGFTKRDLRGFAPDNYVVDLMPQGAIVGVARLAEVFGPEDTITDDHPAFESPWAEDEASYWLYFSELRTVEPVPFKGRVGLFKVPYDVAVNLQPFRLESRVEGNDGIRGAIQHP